eukprot:4679163-Pyramimonas_sp.AAC.1
MRARGCTARNARHVSATTRCNGRRVIVLARVGPSRIPWLEVTQLETEPNARAKRCKRHEHNNAQTILKDGLASGLP